MRIIFDKFRKSIYNFKEIRWNKDVSIFIRARDYSVVFLVRNNRSRSLNILYELINDLILRNFQRANNL